jgi:hypothetical protein
MPTPLIISNNINFIAIFSVKSRPSLCLVYNFDQKSAFFTPRGRADLTTSASSRDTFAVDNHSFMRRCLASAREPRLVNNPGYFFIFFTRLDFEEPDLDDDDRDDVEREELDFFIETVDLEDELREEPFETVLLLFEIYR